jgi:hypothetical protein
VTHTLEYPFQTFSVMGIRTRRPLLQVTGSGLGVHIGPQDCVDAGLVAGVLAEPAEEVGVEADGDDFFWGGQDYFCGFPEGFVCGMGVRVGEDALADGGWAHAIQAVPVGLDFAAARGGAIAIRGLATRGFASSGVFRAAPSATLR